MTLDPFAADILNRCRIAEASYGGHPNPAWSTGEKLAVALVLKDWAYLQGADYSEFEVKRRIAGDIGRSVVEVDAWLDAIRKELEA